MHFRKTIIDIRLSFFVKLAKSLYHTFMEKEKKGFKINKALLRKSIVLLSLLVILIILLILRNNRDFCEFYSRSFVRAYNFVFGHISSFFPFSLFELFVIGTAIYAVTWIVFFIINTKKTGIKNSYHMILRAAIIALSIGTLYQAIAGMEYGRKQVDIPLHYQLIDNPKDYKDICFSFVDDFNYCASQLEYAENGSVISPYSDDILVRNIMEEYKKLDSDYFHEYTSLCKPMYLTGWLYRAMSISGVTFVPSGEANYNVLDPDGFLPFTIAHELAHAKGAMLEENANLVAAYICLNSDDPYIRFSGYNETIWSLGSLVLATNNSNDYGEFYHKVDPRVYANNTYENQYWRDHAFFDKIGEWFNDWYLKLNNDEGTISYTDNIDVEEDEEHEYIVKSYSRYQALYMWLYFDKN